MHSSWARFPCCPELTAAVLLVNVIQNSNSKVVPVPVQFFGGFVLAGMRALVTGAGAGIGKDVALTLAERGAFVVGIDFNAESLGK